jgi:hypothetical protein
MSVIGYHLPYALSLGETARLLHSAGSQSLFKHADLGWPPDMAQPASVSLLSWADKPLAGLRSVILQFSHP